MKKTLLLLVATSVLIAHSAVAQSVAINTDGSTANASAISIGKAGLTTNNLGSEQIAQNLTVQGTTVSLGNGSAATISTPSGNANLSLTPNGTGTLNLGTANTGAVGIGNT